MGALPKKKIPKRRRNNRRSHIHAALPQLGTCPQCRRLKPTHRVCPFCGTYNGHRVLEDKETARPL
jgi:large subunit ribosomal protein L32